MMVFTLLAQLPGPALDQIAQELPQAHLVALSGILDAGTELNRRRLARMTIERWQRFARCKRMLREITNLSFPSDERCRDWYLCYLAEMIIPSSSSPLVWIGHRSTGLSTMRELVASVMEIK